MAIIIYKGISYKSRSELVRTMLIDGKEAKSTIAKKANVTPQTVEYTYKNLIKAGAIEDYYKKYRIENKKTKVKRERLKATDVVISEYDKID